MTNSSDKKDETGNSGELREERGLKIPSEPRPAPNPKPTPQEEQKKS